MWNVFVPVCKINLAFRLLTGLIMNAFPRKRTGADKALFTGPSASKALFSDDGGMCFHDIACGYFV